MPPKEMQISLLRQSSSLLQPSSEQAPPTQRPVLHSASTVHESPTGLSGGGSFSTEMNSVSPQPAPKMATKPAKTVAARKTIMNHDSGQRSWSVTIPQRQGGGNLEAYRMNGRQRIAAFSYCPESSRSPSKFSQSRKEALLPSAYCAPGAASPSAADRQAPVESCQNFVVLRQSPFGLIVHFLAYSAFGPELRRAGRHPNGLKRDDGAVFEQG